MLCVLLQTVVGFAVADAGHAVFETAHQAGALLAFVSLAGGGVFCSTDLDTPVGSEPVLLVSNHLAT